MSFYGTGVHSKRISFDRFIQPSAFPVIPLNIIKIERGNDHIGQESGFEQGIEHKTDNPITSEQSVLLE